MSTALVVGKFAPPHLGHQRAIDTALGLAERVVVLCWANPDFDFADSQQRAGWIATLYPDVEVIAPLDPPLDTAPDGVQREFTAAILSERGISIDVVVTGEDYGDELARSLGAKHHRLDRTHLDITGTSIRADVHARRHLLDPFIYSQFVGRVAILGAESTGKSTLAATLAAKYDTNWVHEYGRELYEERGGRLGLDDYLMIARTHIEREDELMASANRYLFSDTSAITTMMFSHLYERDSLDELRSIAADCATRYRLHVVCDDDIPFEQDGWRDTAAWRARMQGLILADLAARGIPYVVTSGNLDERIQTVEAALEGRITPGHHPPRHPGDLGPRPGDDSHR